MKPLRSECFSDLGSGDKTGLHGGQEHLGSENSECCVGEHSGVALKIIFFSSVGCCYPHDSGKTETWGLLAPGTGAGPWKPAGRFISGL